MSALSSTVLARRRAAAATRCSTCDTWFTPLKGPKRYCSTKCKNAAFGARRRSTPQGRAERLAQYQKRRAAIKGTAVEKIVARDIYERDHWICGLCHEPIPQDAPRRHPLSASLDHVVPLAKGGSHTHENVQAAHLICNGRKGDRAIAV